jgi:hypothetical protein
VGTTIDQLISGIEVEKEAAVKRADKAKAEIKLILDTASAEGRSNLTEEEDARTTELFASIDRAKSDEDGINVKLERANKVKAEEAEADRKSREMRANTGGQAPRQSREEVVSIGSEERAYHKGNDPSGRQFLQDITRSFMYQDPQSQARLARHMAEERVERGMYLQRAEVLSGTVQWAGLTVPQYLTELVAPAVANLRPFADTCTNKHPLPADGMSVNISRVTTPSSVTLQSSEFTDAAGQQVDDTLLTVAVQTASGQQTVSRQAIDRGTGIEDTILQDLFSRYYTVLDSTLLNQATNGLTNVSTAVTFTTPVTGAGLYPKLMGAAAGVEGALLAMGSPDYAVMHSRRWYWLAKEMSSTWPLINSSNVPVQAGGVLNPSSSYNSGVRGVLPNGLQVVVDNNVGTTLGAGTEDEIYVVPSRECHLWEDPSAPAFIRAEQPAAARLGVLLVVYGYFAYTFARYANSMQKVAGAGLIAPTF